MSGRKITWRRGEWRRHVTSTGRVVEGYELDYCVDGMRNATYVGVPDYNMNAFRLVFVSRSPYGEAANVRTVSFFDVKD